MVDIKTGKSLMKKVVERYNLVAENSQLITGLSEQDITTKFMLPFFEVLNWDKLKISDKGPEVHEKAFRDRSDVGKGLPDITLKSEFGKVFVEVKRPGELKKGMANLERYSDADVIVLTTFEELEVYTRFGTESPRQRRAFNFQQYVPEFTQLWDLLSNSKKGKATRAAFKATR